MPRSALAKPLLSLGLLALAACGGASAPPSPEDPKPVVCDSTGLIVALTQPSGPVATNGTVTVHLSFSGPVEEVELLSNGGILAKLSPPYTYAWDTTGVPDGSYLLTGRALCVGRSVHSEPRTVVVDHTPPALTARSPEPGAEVAVGTPIRVEFSEPLLASSVTPGILTLKVDGAAVEAELALSEDRRALTVTPSRPLTPPASVELALAGGLQDALGNTMGAPPAWTFPVPRWIAVHGTVPARPHAAYAGVPLLQLDSTGRPVVGFPAASDGGQCPREGAGAAVDGLGLGVAG